LAYFSNLYFGLANLANEYIYNILYM
jgi:hypothetical protein